MRNQINAKLNDGFSYPRIIEKLKHCDPPLPYPISEMNLSRWHDRGYQRHLSHQDHLAEDRINRAGALALYTVLSFKRFSATEALILSTRLAREKLFARGRDD